MAKKPRYPKKFRQKLERIATAKTQRVADEQDEEAWDRVTQTLHRETMFANTVDLVHARLERNEDRPRLSILTTIHQPPPVADVVYITPDWLLPEKPTS